MLTELLSFLEICFNDFYSLNFALLFYVANYFAFRNMGVDIATYRSRIGCFGGVRLKTVVVCNQCTMDLNIDGTIFFIATLLLIAGIEPNPGPMKSIDAVESKQSAKEEAFEQLLGKSKASIAAFKRPYVEVNEALLQNADNRLKVQRVVIITGKRKSGKTTMAMELIKLIGTDKNILMLDDASQLDQLNYENTEAIVIEDIGGVRPFDELQVKTWANKFETLYSLAVYGKIKIIITIDEELFDKVFKECRHPLFAKSIVTLPEQRRQDNGSPAEIERQSDVVYFQERPQATTFEQWEPKCVVPKKEQFVHYSASVKCWPRVYKSQQIIRDLVERCSYLENKFKLRVTQYEYLSEIDIYISSRVNLEFKSLLMRPDQFERKGTVCLDVTQRTLKDQPFPLRQNVSGLLIHENAIELIQEVSPNKMHMVVASSSDTNPSHNLEPKRVKFELTSLLERVVFDILTAEFNTLKQLYENSMPQTFSDPSSFLSLSEWKAGESMTPSLKDMVIQHKNTIEQLLGEMIALFNRSNIEEIKRPAMLGFEKKQVSKEVVKQLFRLDDTIRGCGYSYSTFNVNVEYLPDQAKTIKRQKGIEDFLERNGITNVKFNIVSKRVTEYKSVGAMVSTPTIGQPEGYRSGTLGGFASLNKANKVTSCALFSRHVALGCKLKLYVDDNGQRKELGEILEDTLQDGSYDIAAAKIHAEQVSNCDVEFKNSENTPRPGKLYTATANINLQHLPVHLWGSQSKPGLGIIKIPEFSYAEATEIYIEIEDRDPSGEQAFQRMAVEGDSGAIVCADDLDDEIVHVISMLMGSSNYEMHSEDSNVKAKYMSFPLHKGVEHLQNKTNGIFSLEGIVNDSENDTE
ncbi:uncharacterized protein LOC128551887 isoform X2 [Mercenaria mercenaria]|uniref:uncharacterized protein LOC128551887 isoform X2 n=1 Tax=Mercenaria mercenaria TaxID=6596 RepID=UPI00234F8AA5|nr:uncharacterized protein LOC128551887 isoform X2 [Mercenaria mercenaria]